MENRMESKTMNEQHKATIQEVLYDKLDTLQTIISLHEPHGDDPDHREILDGAEERIASVTEALAALDADPVTVYNANNTDATIIHDFIGNSDMPADAKTEAADALQRMLQQMELLHVSVDPEALTITYGMGVTDEKRRQRDTPQMPQALTPAEHAVMVSLLVQQLGDISERSYAAGWMEGLERDIWHAMHDGGIRGMYVLDEEEITTLKTLSKLIGGWVEWKHAAISAGPQFVPMEKWGPGYMQRRPTQEES